ncbi:MAG: class I SAM-dependent methyltransferase, partial [Dactylosporangium sp.]|nr:class I SAM-dependent methyltransferase [Dactylosporangium sp.]
MRSEAVFTRPRPDCPNPQWWHAPDANATEAEVTELVAAMVRALQPEFVLETGTHAGTTAEAIGQALAANGHGWLVSLELDPAKASAAAERLAAAGLPVTVVGGDSRSYVPDRPIDFAWFDSSIEARVPEYERILPY